MLMSRPPPRTRQDLTLSDSKPTYTITSTAPASRPARRSTHSRPPADRVGARSATRS